MRWVDLKFDFIVVAIQESKDVKTMKIKELKSSLEIRELLAIYIGVERLIQQAFQAQVVKKYSHERKFKKKIKESFRSGSSSNNDNTKVDDKIKSSKGGGDFDTNQLKKKKFDKIKV